MRFHLASDNQWLQELVDHRVVPVGLAGFAAKDGTGLLDTLITNAERVDTAAWLEWLTSIRRLARLHVLKADPGWIAGLGIDRALRRRLFDEGILPCRLSAGRWICASLRGGAEWRHQWERSLGARLVLCAPTLSELRLIRQHYQGAY